MRVSFFDHQGRKTWFDTKDVFFMSNVQPGIIEVTLIRDDIKVIIHIAATTEEINKLWGEDAKSNSKKN